MRLFAVAAAFLLWGAGGTIRHSFTVRTADLFGGLEAIEASPTLELLSPGGLAY